MHIAVDKYVSSKWPLRLTSICQDTNINYDRIYRHFGMELWLYFGGYQVTLPYFVQKVGWKVYLASTIKKTTCIIKAISATASIH